MGIPAKTNPLRDLALIPAAIKKRKYLSFRDTGMSFDRTLEYGSRQGVSYSLSRLHSVSAKKCTHLILLWGDNEIGVRLLFAGREMAVMGFVIVGKFDKFFFDKITAQIVCEASAARAIEIRGFLESSDKTQIFVSNLVKYGGAEIKRNDGAKLMFLIKRVKK